MLKETQATDKSQSNMASSMGGMFPGQQQQQQPPGAHPPPPGPGASGARASNNTLVDDLEASFEVRTLFSWLFYVVCELACG